MIIAGNWHGCTLDSPLTGLPGDSFRVSDDRTRVELWRGGVMVDSRLLTVGPAVSLVPLVDAVTIDSLYFFKEQKMPGSNIALVDVTVGGAGSVIFKFSDGDQNEFSSWQAVIDSVTDLDTAGSINKQLLIARTIARSPDGANKTNMVEGSCSINREAAIPVVVTYPE